MRRFLFLALILIATPALFAQDANNARGFTSGNSFQGFDIDNVNTFNGNLMVTIPLVDFPVGPRLRQQLLLAYNSKVYEYQWVQFRAFPADPQDKRRAVPEKYSNAGLGWLLTLGSLHEPTAGDEVNPVRGWFYRGPDGSEHDFTEGLGAVTSAMTHDGSFLRLQRDTEDPVDYYDIELPDGTVHRFGSYDAATKSWALTRISDSLGYWIEVDDDDPMKWLITGGFEEQTLRTITVHFQNRTAPVGGSYVDNPNFQKTIQSIEVPVTGSDTPVLYELTQVDSMIRRDGCGDEIEGDAHEIAVPLLTEIKFPDGSTYVPAYYTTYAGPECATGLLHAMTLPTKGTIRWQQGLYRLSIPECNDNTGWIIETPGVRARSIEDANGTVLGTWTYTPAINLNAGQYVACGVFDGINMPFGPAPTEATTTVTMTENGVPVGGKTVHYFSAVLNGHRATALGLNTKEYGLSFTRLRPDPIDGTRFLSSQRFDEDDTLLRTRYVAYAADAQPFNEKLSNARLQAELTLFDDDPGCTDPDGCWIALERDEAEYDGYGHYRKLVNRSSFGPTQTTFTNYVAPPANLWLLGLHDSAWVEEDGVATKQQFTYDQHGFLESQRTFFNTAAHAAEIGPDNHRDLLQVTCRDERGYLLAEKSFGGDDSAAGIPSGVLCDALPQAGEYQIDHTYTYSASGAPIKHTANFRGFDFFLLDQDLDAKTGFVTASRDTADVETTYTYDEIGRPKEVKPEGAPWLKYDYENAGTGTPASLRVTTRAADTDETSPALLDTYTYYDALGRPVQTATATANNEWSVTWTEFDIFNRARSVTVPVTTSSKDFGAAPSGVGKSTSTYDALGRITLDRQPDNTTTSSVYRGIREIERYVGNVRRSTEISNNLGRLVQVVQQPDAASDPITTAYGYDVGGRLTNVSIAAPPSQSVAQERTFEYDGRGFLKRETHPETGEATAGDYDALGNARQRTAGGRTRIYTFDGASRLRTIRESTATEPIKSFDFGLANSGWNDQNKQKGKMVSAVRRNVLPSGPVVEVTETYDYEGPAGKISKRTTSVDEIQGTTRKAIQKFEQSIEYDDLLSPSRQAMPSCLTFGCGIPAGLENIWYQRDHGFLKAVTGLATLTYHPSGMIHTVRHASSPAALDTYADADGMGRPSSITFDAPQPPNCSDPATGITVSAPQSTAAPLGSTVNLSVAASSSVTPLTYQWFEGRRETGNAVAIPGATSAAFTTSPLQTSTVYWVRVSNVCHTADSEYAVITVDTCSFYLLGKGPGDSTFKPAPEVEASDYVVPRGTDVVLEVLPQLIEGQPPLTYTYLWTDDAGSGNGSSYTVLNVQGPRVITASVTGTTGGFSCTRTITFRIDVCDTPLVIRAGTCLVSDVPEAYVRRGTTVRLLSELLTADVSGDLRPVNDDELAAVQFTWKDSLGNTIATGSGAAVYLQSYQVPTANVPEWLQLKVMSASCTRTLRMPLRVLSDPPCNPATESCEASCVLGHVRVNGVPLQFYSFTTREEVDLTPPAQFPGNLSQIEWHRVRNGVDEVISREYLLHREMITPAQIYVLGVANGVLYTSSRLTTELSSASAGVTVTPAYQEIQAGSSASVTVQVAGATPTEYEWRIGSKYDTSRTIIGHSQTVHITLFHDTVLWCRVKVDGVWKLSPIAQIVTTCTNDVGGFAVPHPRFVPKDGYSFVAAAIHGKLEAMYWYERNADNSKTRLTSGMSSAINYYPHQAATTLGADLIDTCGTVGELNETTIYMCVPTVTQQPQSVIVPGNGTATLTAAATPAIAGQNITITWCDEADQYHVTPLGTGPSFTTPAIPAGTSKSYVAAFVAQCVPGGQTYLHESDVAVVRACVNPSVTGVPVTIWSQTPGGDVNVNITASGTNLTYQWYEGATGDISRPQAGKTASAVTLRPTTTTNYWCRVQSEGVCITDTSTIQVRVCTAPPITTQPLSTRIFKNTSTTLTVAASATGNTEPITYQWQTQNAGGAWVNISGATATSYTTPVFSDTLQAATYRVIVSAGACSTTSNVASVNVCTYPAVVSVQNRKVRYNESVYLSLPSLSPVENKNITWYRGMSGDKTQPMRSGYGSDLLNETGPLTTTGYFWAEFEHLGCVSKTETYVVEVCIPEITVQPTPRTIPAGTATTLTLTTTAIAGQTYSWYRGAVGDTTNLVSTGASPSIQVSPTATTTYWCRVTSPCASTVDSQAVTVTTCSPATITAIYLNPSYAVPSGTTVELRINASGSNKTYQWYRGNKGDTSNPVTNGTTDIINRTITATTNYWCRVTTDGICQMDSETVTVTMCTNPTITTEPASQNLFAGTTSATLSVAATPLPVTYQWYTGNSGDTGAPINGATAASVTVQPAATTNYWVRVSNGGCKDDSVTATVTKCLYAQQVTAKTPTNNVAYGETLTLSLPTLSPTADKNVTWYKGAVGNRTNAVGSGTNVPYIANHYQSATYWAEFSHNGCVSQTTAYAVNVCKPTITSQPQGDVINSGQTKTLTVVASGESLTYQWYTGASGNTASPIPGATSSSYLATPGVDTTYWVRVSGCTTADSAAATVQVCVAPSISGITKGNDGRNGDAAFLTVSATGPNLTYQWYRGQSGDVSTPINGATAATHNFTLTTTNYYWVRVTSGCAGGLTRTTDSAAVLYSVFPTISKNPANTAIPSGGRTLLTVTAAGGYLTYQWYETTGYSSTPISGATASTYLTPAATTTKKYFVRVTSGALYINSSVAQIDICQGPAIVSFTSSGSNDDFTFRVTVDNDDEDFVTYHWYSGTVGVPSQSVDRGEGADLRTFNNITPLPSTFWVRVTYNDGRCYQDTVGRTVP